MVLMFKNQYTESDSKQPDKVRDHFPVTSVVEFSTSANNPKMYSTPISSVSPQSS